MDATNGKNLLIGVTGGIAAYKALELCRRAIDAGYSVRVVLTEAAREFVTPMSFQALTGHAPRVSLWDEAAESAMGHIELARWAGRILIAPATADFIAKLRLGLANDLLGTLCLASAAPLSIAPAMNQQMFAHAATQENLVVLRKRGVQIIGPAAGAQACGDVGLGRMSEVPEILHAIARPVAGTALRDVRILITTGPTYEEIDPVRFLGNHSSGKMGFALAEAAAAAGASVTVVAGPCSASAPAGISVVSVRSAQQMHAEVMARVPESDVFIGAAAVADYRPAVVAAQKMKKTAGLHLELIANPDIIADVARCKPKPFVVGFAAETQDMEHHAQEKRLRKGMDLICGNIVGNGRAFGTDDNALLVLGDAIRTELGAAPKRELAAKVIEILAAQFNRSAINGR